MAANMDWNTVPTAKIAYDALRQRNLEFGVPDFEGPLMPWELLRARLPRDPVVFMISSDAPAGDEAPYFRLLAELVEQLPGRYVLLRATMEKHGIAGWSPPSNQSAYEELKGKIEETDDCDEWAQKFREAQPDAVLTSQLFFIPNTATPEIDVRIPFLSLLNQLRFELEFPIYTIESTPLNAGVCWHTNNWRNRLQDGSASVDEYQKWHARPEVDQTEVVQNRFKMGQKYGVTMPLALNCYPAEMMTEEEMTRTVGILCGPVEPAINDRGLPKVLRSVIESARGSGEKIVFLARGGRYARTAAAFDSGNGGRKLIRFHEGIEKELKHDDMISALNDGELAKFLLGDAVVIAMSAVWSDLKVVQPGLVSLPYLELDYAAILPHVDLVVHHGGAGTTIAALKAGVPQVIVPNTGDCPDQVYHGARVAAMGCGTFLKPHVRFTKTSPELKDVLQAARRSLQPPPELKKACLEWKAKLRDSGRTEGVPVAVDTVRRLIASVVMAGGYDHGTDLDDLPTPPSPA